MTCTTLAIGHGGSVNYCNKLLFLQPMTFIIKQFEGLSYGERMQLVNINHTKIHAKIIQGEIYIKVKITDQGLYTKIRLVQSILNLFFLPSSGDGKVCEEI